MSLRKRLSRQRHEEAGRDYPRLVVVAEGVDDVYRLARHLEMGQSDIATLGRNALRSLEREWPGLVFELQQRMGPARGGHRYRRPRAVQLRLGMPDEELARLEETTR